MKTNPKREKNNYINIYPKRYDIEEVFNIDRGERIQTYKQIWTDCVICWLKGSHFLLQKSKHQEAKTWHFNLYSDNKLLFSKHKNINWEYNLYCEVCAREQQHKWIIS